jgi:hypothetical protein
MAILTKRTIDEEKSELVLVTTSERAQRLLRWNAAGVRICNKVGPNATKAFCKTVSDG